MNDQEPGSTISKLADVQQRSASPTGPPKQRFKASAHKLGPAVQPKLKNQGKGEKRSLQDLLEAAEAEVYPVIDQGKGSDGTPEPEIQARFEGRFESKNPRQVSSLLLNIAQPHKPRIGPEYQAVLPPMPKRVQ